MNKTEVAKLLTIASSIDNRNVNEVAIEGWYAVLHTLPFEDAVNAVRQHFEDSTEYLLPAHVKAGVKRIRQLRNPDNDTTPQAYRELAEGKRESAPKPDNFDAMCKAWNDPVLWAVECARYDEQLITAGFPPVGPRIGATWQPSEQRRAA